MERLRKNAKWYVLGMLVAVNFFVWYAVFAEERDVLTVAFLDVGQGDAIFIESPSGQQMLIDGGAGRAVLRELGSVMPFYDRSIDVVLATHPDKDHIGGLPDVLERYEVDYFFEPGVVSDSSIYEEIVRLIKVNDVEHVLARRGMTVDLGNDVYVKILFPDRDVSYVETNAGSVIMQIIYGDTEFMLTGDSPQSIEKYVSAIDGTALRSDVLKAGHHGSKTSSAPVFVGFVSPQYAVVSADEDNSYGHPHQEVLDTIEQFGATILATYENGTIIFESDGLTVRMR